jgi:pimeloyl-ACP methyl ester carboxylesterase
VKPRIAIPYLCLVLTGCTSGERQGDGSALADVRTARDERPAAARSAHNAGPAECAVIGIEAADYVIPFRAEGMIDDQYNGKLAKLSVHRVKPAYARECANPFNRAAVLIHGRTIAARPNFDLRHDGGGELSVQEGLAWAGIDTFAPDMLGYGRSTRFGLDDPCNASRADDTSNNTGIFPLNQQGTALSVNPLAGELCAHSSSVRFGNTDLWVRDVERAIDDAIQKGHPEGDQVTLIGYSFGAQRVGRALDPDRYYVDGVPNQIIHKVNKVVFGAPLFLAPFGASQMRDEPSTTWASFPLALSGRGGFAIPNPSREAACLGHIVPGSEQEFWEQSLDRDYDAISSTWGGSVPGQPTGLIRSPTFSTYGFNQSVAALLTLPTLVIQGLDDGPPAMPPGTPGPAHSCALYKSLPATLDKVLVHVGCAYHTFILEGCAAPGPGAELPARCQGHPGVTPYGGNDGAGWAGPHSTFVAAVAEWIKEGTFTVPGHAPATQGKFVVDDSGVAHVQGEDGTAVSCQ